MLNAFFFPFDAAVTVAVAFLVMTTQRLPTSTAITKITTGEDDHYGEVIRGTMTGTIAIHPPVLPPPRVIILLLVGAMLHMHPTQVTSSTQTTELTPKAS